MEKEFLQTKKEMFMKVNGRIIKGVVKGNWYGRMVNVMMVSGWIINLMGMERCFIKIVINIMDNGRII